MFNENFYPTPTNLIYEMINNCYFNGDSRILEPSAGKGNIVDYIIDKNRYLKDKIDCIEFDNNLQNILIGKGFNLVFNDFLNFETSTEYTHIVMNPPFSNGESHLFKAILLAEKQTIKNCEIICLLNAEKLKNPFSNIRKSLISKLGELNASINYIERQYVEAERKTAVEVAIIKLKIICNKNEKNHVQNILSGNFKQSIKTTDISLYNSAITMRLSNINQLIDLYNYHVEELKTFYASESRLQYFKKELSKIDVKYYGVGMQSSCYHQSLEELRISYWQAILLTKEFKDKLTNSAHDELMRKISEMKHLEINTYNVCKMLRGISNNHTSILLDTLVTVFDSITKYNMSSFSKNIHYYNGWKTNNAFMINKKIIIPLVSRYVYTVKENEFDFEQQKFVDDLIKILELLNGEKIPDLKNTSTRVFENDYLYIKKYLKGTLHITFKKMDILNRFNFLVGQQRGWLPSDEELSDKKAMDFVSDLFDVEVLNLKSIGK